MWFPSSDIFLNINLSYKDNKIFTPIVHTQSKQLVSIEHNLDKLQQNLKIKVTVPELLYIEFKNVTQAISVNDILIDKIQINPKNFKEVFKFCPNPNNLSIDAIDKLPKKISNSIYTNGFLIFDLYETDAISYLLSIKNKIDF